MKTKKKLAYAACGAFAASTGLLLVESAMVYVPLIMSTLAGTALYLLFSSENS